MKGTPGRATLDAGAGAGAGAAPARVLIVGGGAREHALAWLLASEPGVERVVVAPGSDAIGEVTGVDCRVECRPAIRPTHGPEVAALAVREAVDLAVIGPEAPLAAGVADALLAAGIATFGPTAAAARIEASKSFCRAIADDAGIRMARGAAFTDLRAAMAFARGLASGGAGVVVKADGLMAGKGVRICTDAADAEDAIRTFAAASAAAGSAAADGGEAGEPLVVVEERLAGREASVIALCDGRVALALPAARDHKRLGDDDTGPNTGGMGAYAPLPDLDDAAVAEIVRTFHEPALAALARRGTPFRGALYAGLMLTEDGPILLEFNARFGDPETQVLLPLLERPLGPLLAAAARGRLAEAARALGTAGHVVPAEGAATVGIVLASAGYPELPRSGDEIHGVDAARATGALVFHAGTERDASGAWRTRGGRILTVVGVGSAIAAARALAEQAADLVDFAGVQRRRDIAAVVPRRAARIVAGHPPGVGAAR